MKLFALLLAGLFFSPAFSAEKLQIPSRSYGFLPGYIFKTNQAPRGLIIYLHGGAAGLGGQASDELSPPLEALNETGYIVFNASYTGDTVDELGNYLNIPDGEDVHPKDYYSAELLDIADAETYFLKQYPDLPVFIYGFSHGALLVNLYAGYYAEKTRASGFISDAGIWDLALASNDSSGNEKMSWYISDYMTTPQVNWNDYGKQWPIENEEIVGLENARAVLEQRLSMSEIDIAIFYTPEKPLFTNKNPLHFVNAVSKPIFVRHGKNDTSVLFNQHQSLIRVVAMNSKFTLYSDTAGHDVSESSSYTEYLKSLENFLSSEP